MFVVFIHVKTFTSVLKEITQVSKVKKMNEFFYHLDLPLNSYQVRVRIQIVCEEFLIQFLDDNLVIVDFLKKLLIFNCGTNHKLFSWTTWDSHTSITKLSRKYHILDRKTGKPKK